ncbi:hypothetical protein SEA_MABODAMACA_34 [Microbacterium phage Mabodamaca]|uniref:Uncharacterized protein n=1 Tax=Microbacterium phage Mabodamaca TaxID=3078574 RepID=A0AA96NHG3_9CAUD|nr:hypothetical protein SEA_MABODAMACA_34 [Microbacterium phage Mabodamaca]
MNPATDTTETQPDDLAPGIYRDRDGDLWAVDKHGMAHVLTDTIAASLGVGTPVLTDEELSLSEGLPADTAHVIFELRMIRSLQA